MNKEAMMHRPPRAGHGLPRLYRLLLLLAIPCIVGSKCVFLFSSGGSGDDEEEKDEREGLTVIVREGHFAGEPVAGLGYEAGALSGITGPQGEFEYEAGSTVRFFIGDIALGEPVAGRDSITLPDLVPGGGVESPAVINIARLLQSLDARPGDGSITLPAAIHAQARRSNELVSPSIDYLDFADQAAFANAASQLVAVLAASNPRTAELIDSDVARERLQRALERLSPTANSRGEPR